jgi:hypothetical protein
MKGINMFRNAKIGDKVYNYQRGEWGTITLVDPDEEYPIIVVYPSRYDESYTFDGCYNICYKNPVIFWDFVPPITPPPKPKQKVKVVKWVTMWGSKISELINCSKYIVLYCYDTEEEAKTAGVPYGKIVIEVEEK